MEEKIIFTEEGYAEIVKELEYLKGEWRTEITEKLKEARSFGDLSENAEYDAARDEQAEKEARIKELEDMVRRAEVTKSDDVNIKTVGVATKVTVENVKTGEKSIYAIVGTTEADPFAEPVPKISTESLVGQHLLGKKRNDTVTFMVPDGEVTLKVIKIGR